MESKFGPPRQKDINRLTSIEIFFFFRRTAWYIILDNKRNKEILVELKVEPESCIILYTIVCLYVCNVSLALTYCHLPTLMLHCEET